MRPVSSFQVLMLFARLSMTRFLNRTSAYGAKANRSFRWFKSKPDATPAAPHDAVTDVLPVDAEVRRGTRHRKERKSIFSRILSMWLPLTSLLGLVMLALVTIFTIFDAVRYEEARERGVIYLSQDKIDRIRTALANTDEASREAALTDALKQTFDSPAKWLGKAQTTLARTLIDTKGPEAFAPWPEERKGEGVLSDLSPAGQQRALRTIGLYLTLLNLAIAGTAFSLSCSRVGKTDDSLVWMWQFPVSHRVLFASKLVGAICDQVTIPVIALFYATLLWCRGTPFWAGAGIAVALALGTGLAIAAVRTAGEVILVQRLGRTLRGMVIGAAGFLGSVVFLISMFGLNSQMIAEGLFAAAAMVPDWVLLNPFSNGFGTDLMQHHDLAWWLMPTVISVLLAVVSVELCGWLTSRGLEVPVDSLQGGHRRAGAAPSMTRTSTGGMIATRFPSMAGVPVSPELTRLLLRLRRHPEKLGMAALAPAIAFFPLYVTYQNDVSAFLTQGAGTVSTAILAAAAYMLISAAGDTVQAEGKTLWMLQCQPVPLAHAFRASARLWGTIAILIALPFFATLFIYRPELARVIAMNMAYVMAVLWLLSETIFGCCALGASINNEQTVRLNPSASLLPTLIVAAIGLTIYQQNPWGMLNSLTMLVILRVAVVEQQLIELPWLSEPEGTPKRAFYPVDALVVLMGFDFVMNFSRAFLVMQPHVSTPMAVSGSYLLGAVISSGVCLLWMRSNEISAPAAQRRGSVLVQLLLWIPICCGAGAALIAVLESMSQHLPQTLMASSPDAKHGPWDRWWMFAMWVVAAPLFEEWAFRGLIFRSLRRSWPFLPSLAVSVALFITMHPWQGAPALIVLATATAWTTEKTGRLWPGMIIHAIYNGMVWSMTSF